MKLLPETACVLEGSIIGRLDAASADIVSALKELEQDTKQAEDIADALEAAKYYEAHVLKSMEKLRKIVDGAEALIPEEYLPYPTYGEMMFSLR